MESIDDLLAQVKAEYEEKAKEVRKPQPLPPRRLREQPPVVTTDQIQAKSPNLAYAAEDILIAEVRAEFEAQEQAKQLEKAQQLREEQLKQQQRKQQQRDALAKQAQMWLKKLDPLSEEGLWFEEFAYTYSSKIEAAIDYLEALQKTKP